MARIEDTCPDVELIKLEASVDGETWHEVFFEGFSPGYRDSIIPEMTYGWPMLRIVPRREWVDELLERLWELI